MTRKKKKDEVGAWWWWRRRVVPKSVLVVPYYVPYLSPVVAKFGDGLFFAREDPSHLDNFAAHLLYITS